jgi:hypothetical protein
MYSLPWSNFNLLIDKKVKEAVSKLQQFYFPWLIQIATVACAPSLYDKMMVKLVPITNPVCSSILSPDNNGAGD